MNRSQTQIQEILAEYADGLARGNVRLDDIVRKYHIEPESDLESLLLLAQALESVLVRVQPSHAFVEQLRKDLLEEQDIISVIDRLRQLSTRQVAASIAGIGGLTVAAGMLIWIGRNGVERMLRRADMTDTPEPALA